MGGFLAKPFALKDDAVLKPGPGELGYFLDLI
jgi:hypothetical protein